MKVVLKNLTKVFPNRNKKIGGEVVAVSNFDFEIPDGKLIGLLGPSGCGKSTTLYMIAGLQKPSSGQIFFGEDDVTTLAAEKRGIGLVFQNYALYPHMTVKQNILFPLQNLRGSDKLSKDDMLKRAEEAAKLVQIDELMDRKPSELSGGQPQRVAIARALVKTPRVLLLDEPLGALDLKLRQEMLYELRRLKNELGITFLYVTHDQEEALTMSDKVVVMNQGYIQQMGTPEQIYNEPENAFVADFIGDSNIVDGIMVEDYVVKINGYKFPCIDAGFGRNKPVDVVIRPEDIEIGKPGSGIIDGVVTSNVFIGVHYEMCIEAGGIEWLCQNTKSFAVGQQVSIGVAPENIQIMNKPQSEDEEAISLEDVLGEEQDQ